MKNIKLVRDVRALGALTEQMARIKRAVAYPDGQRESDAEHSFMGALIGRSLAAQFCPELDANKVCWYFTVHDLLEIYTGDADTLTADAKVYTGKEELEAVSLWQLQQDFGAAWPSLAQAVTDYESQHEPEARFVKVIDKILPALCELADGGQRLRERGITTVAKHKDSLRLMDAKLQRVAPDQTFALRLRQDFIATVRQEVFGAQAAAPGDSSVLL